MPLPASVSGASCCSRRQAIRWPVAWLAWTVCLLPRMGAAEPLSADSAERFEKVVRPFLASHCLECHGAITREANLRFDQLAGYASDQQHLWTTVHEALRQNRMPPEGQPRPSESDRRAVLDWIRRRQRAHRTGTTRRLNRRELSAALRDVTGLRVDFAAALPGDGKIDGFDTGADALQDAAASLAQTMRVTRRAVEAIRFLEPPPSVVFRADLRGADDPRKALEAWKDQGASVKIRDHAQPGAGLLLQPKWLGERDGLTFHVPPPEGRRGVLRLRLLVSAQKYEDHLPNSHLLVEVGGQALDYREVSEPLDQPLELIYEVHLGDVAVETRGVEITLKNLVEVPYAVEGFENDERGEPEDNLPRGTDLFRPAFDRRKLPPEKQPVPFVVLQGVEVMPDHVVAWPPEDWQVEVEPLEDSRQCAERLMEFWVDRAWRRPADAAERQRFVTLYEKLREQGLSFDDALRASFQAVLLSGPFRYLASPGGAGTEPISGRRSELAPAGPTEAEPTEESRGQYAIASRLSFLLTAAPPDAELRRLAAAGKLRDPQTLGEQVDRLLADPRSEAFFQSFVTQWLELEQPITITSPSIKLQQFRFARYLKDSMRRETVAYVRQLFTENRPARELVDSRWTMMNDILARHYGYDGIRGGHFRRVALREDDPRGGGLLGHAGIQSMLCWMGDNWVIYRGAWTLRNILDDPPPPPPLEVPELDPSAGEHRGKTFKELLELHQRDERCAVCHRKMDPLGFAFQNFDLSGRWRDVEYEKYTRNELDGKIEWYGSGATRPVDASGRLPRGEAFASYGEWKTLVVRHYLADVVGGLLKKLMLYATGRRPDVDDLAEIEAIMRRHEIQGYPLREMLKDVARGRSFLTH